ncbi:MAG TPA: dihydrofolate reductase family protein, partial [Vampirovibrionales bacterium]
LVLTQPGANPDMQQWLLNKGVEVIELDPLTPAIVMEYLYKREFLSVLWECGGLLAARAIADGAVQKILAFIAPKIVGGQSAPSPVGNLGLTRMGDALTLDRVKWRTIGTDCVVEGYLKLKE